MKFNNNLNVLIVGLGLMGGSYAKALTKKGFNVTAITKDIESIEYAKKNKIIKEGAAFPDKALIEKADLIVLAVYPHIVKEWILDNQANFKSGVIITDVTGVKSNIVYDVQDILKPDAEFIAAHPMAGREVYGVKNSDDAIFKGANYIVVPTNKNTNEAIELCKKLGETLGFERVSELSPESHDKMIAFLSQLTHCIAVSLMCANGDPDLVSYTGDSFRDLTRIAKINDEMWSELFLANREALLSEMDSFKESFERLYGFIRDNDRDAMREMMRCSTKRRKFFDKK